MGITICDMHGTVGISLVTPVISAAMLEERDFDPTSICLIRCTELSDDDVFACWSDRVTADRLRIPRDRIMSLEEFGAC